MLAEDSLCSELYFENNDFILLNLNLIHQLQ